MTAPRVLITGANTGIGFTTAEHLLNNGADLILACRNMDKARAAQAKLQQLSKGQVDLIQLDLNSLASVCTAADEVSERYGALDVLINNAGIFGQRLAYTEDGFEQQFGVNYLGPFLLTQRLLPVLQQAPHARIIHLSSIMHWLGSIQPESFRGKTPYNAVAAYGQSKLANLLFSHALAKRLVGTSMTSNALHPGGVDSDIYRDLPKLMHKAMQLFLVPTSRPAALISNMALSPEWASKNGEYVSAHMPDWQSKQAKDGALADQLYAQSLELVRDYLL